MAQDRMQRVVVEEAPYPLAPATPATVAERRKALAEEYGRWEATAPIDEPVTGARMFNVGDRVPRSHVEAYPDLFEGCVRDLDEDSADDKASKAAKASAPAAPKTKEG